MSSVQLLLPDPCYCWNTNISCYFISPFGLFWIWFFIYFEYNGIKKFEVVSLTRMVWISSKCLQSNNRDLSSSFHLSGLSFPKSNGVDREGEVWIRWSQRCFLQSCSSRRMLVLGPHSSSVFIVKPSIGRDTLSSMWKLSCTLILVHFLEGSCLTSLINKIGKDFFPFVISSITFTRRFY